MRRIFNNSSIPAPYRANFFHLYMDIGWFGILSGSTLNFLNIYATRLGATGLQIGLLGAIPAIVSLVFAIPAGRWLEKRAMGRAVFWTSVFYRIGFLLLVPLPWLFGAQGQIWGMTIVSLLMGIPLVALSVGFSALFAEAVPPEWRAHVAGTRNVVLAITYMLASLGSGYLLDRIVFPLNYQIVFLIGFFGAAMSSLHLFFIKPTPGAPDATPFQPASPSNQPLPRSGRLAALRLDIWRTPFRNTLLVLFAFHLAQYLALPIFPLYNVRELRLTDEYLGIGSALFYLAVLTVSTQLNPLTRRLGHKNVTGLGVMGMALYPIFLAFSSQVWQFYGVSILGGLVWALASAASANYILDRTPENDRPAHLAWYNIILNACVLGGSLLGPLVAAQTGLVAALVLIGLLRGLAGFAILKWG
jgi:MFS family permease